MMVRGKEGAGIDDDARSSGDRLGVVGVGRGLRDRYIANTPAWAR
jgi:hypothetical protein